MKIIFSILALGFMLSIMGCKKSDQNITTLELCWKCEVKALRGNEYVTKRFINYSGFTLQEVKSMTDYYNTDTTLAIYSVMACQ